MFQRLQEAIGDERNATQICWQRPKNVTPVFPIMVRENSLHLLVCVYKKYYANHAHMKMYLECLDIFLLGFAHIFMGTILRDLCTLGDPQGCCLGRPPFLAPLSLPLPALTHPLEKAVIKHCRQTHNGKRAHLTRRTRKITTWMLR